MADTLPAWAANLRYDARPIRSCVRDCRQCQRCVIVSHQDFCLATDEWINDGRVASVCDDFEAVPEIEEAE